MVEHGGGVGACRAYCPCLLRKLFAGIKIVWTTFEWRRRQAKNMCVVHVLMLLLIRRIGGKSGKNLEEIWAFGSESLDVDLGSCSLKVDLRDTTFDPFDDAVMGRVHLHVNNMRDPPPALNAVRRSRSLLKDIPDPRTFRIVLKALRLWAECRCIYGKSFGYFGGVSWAIIVADVCRCCAASDGIGAGDTDVVIAGAAVAVA